MHINLEKLKVPGRHHKRIDKDSQNSMLRPGRKAPTVLFSLLRVGSRPAIHIDTCAQTTSHKPVGIVMVTKHSTLGGLIRLVRRQNSWTLRQLSERVGIPLSTLAKVEADKLSLTYDKLQQFTARLGLSMTEFLAQGETPPAAAPAIFTARRSLSPTAAIRSKSRLQITITSICALIFEKNVWCPS